MRKYWLSAFLTAMIGVCALGNFSRAQQVCCSSDETILSANGVDLASTKQGTLNTLFCQVDEVVTLDVRTVYIAMGPFGGPCDPGSCPTLDAIVVEWKNWYPSIIDVESSGSATTTATCKATGTASIGVEVEEPHNACMRDFGCVAVSSGFPVVSAPVEVEN